MSNHTKTDVTVQLTLTNKDGGFKNEASMLRWISACLNCNVNHVEAEVSIAKPGGAEEAVKL